MQLSSSCTGNKQRIAPYRQHTGGHVRHEAQSRHLPALPAGTRAPEVGGGAHHDHAARCAAGGEERGPFCTGDAAGQGGGPHPEREALLAGAPGALHWGSGAAPVPGCMPTPTWLAAVGQVAVQVLGHVQDVLNARLLPVSGQACCTEEPAACHERCHTDALEARACCAILTIDFGSLTGRSCVAGGVLN